MSFELPLGLSTFRVSASIVTDVEVNGLPRLPSSVTCFSRLCSLRNLRHPHLCRYLDVIRRKPERLLTITEAYATSLADCSAPISDFLWLSSRLSECFSALHFLNQNGLVHACLNPSYIMLDSKGMCKIAVYGLFYATGWGKDVDFPVADPVYSAPEVFLSSPISQPVDVPRQLSGVERLAAVDAFKPCPLNISADVWSLGLIFFELIRGREVTNALRRSEKQESGGFKPFATIRIILEGLYRCSNDQNSRLPDFLGFTSSEPIGDAELQNLEQVCLDCLHFDARLRPKPHKTLKQLKLLSLKRVATQMPKLDCNLSVERTCFVTPSTGSCDTSISSTKPAATHDRAFAKAIDFLSNRSDIAEVYYYWHLAGGNIDAVWKEAELCGKHNLVHTTPTANGCLSTNNRSLVAKNWSRSPILRVPHYLALMRNELSGVFFLTEHWPSSFGDERISFDPRIIPLPGERLLDRIQRIPISVLYPLLSNMCSTLPRVYSTESSYVRNSFECSLSSTNLNKNTVLSPVTRLLFNTDLPRDVGMDVHGTPREPDPMLGQPVSIKEKDVEYQVSRVCLFNRLLNALPVTERRLRLEARKDIPPFLRARIWSALLGVHCDHDYRERYAKALCSTTVRRSICKSDAGDVDTALTPDRDCDSTTAAVDATWTGQAVDTIYGLLDEKAANQISVDLPRCHAYDALLASPMGQASLRRVLVATLLMHPGSLEYTQGMDSVAAVFVRLFFPDEAQAAACLHALLLSKLPTFFSTGRFTDGLRTFFDVLLRLFAFHIPALAVNMIDLNVPLVGLTTGWIYTLFAHSMPLDRVEVMWDTLIVGPPALSLFFYLAIFLQLDQQVNFETLGLERICTILSNFPEIDLDKCRADALRFALATPISLIHSCSEFLSSAVAGSGELATDHHHHHRTRLHTMTDASRSSSECTKSAFYARLCCPDTWPEHLECDEAQPITTPVGRQSLWMAKDPLVPMLDPTDALEHLVRPDCVVIDVRPKSDYAKGCIVNSIYRSPSVVASLQLTSETTPQSPDEPVTPVSTITEDWEFVDHPGGSRRQARVLPTFLVSLMSDEAWKRAAKARRDASTQQLANYNGPTSQHGHTQAYSGQCPGLTLIVGGVDTNPLENKAIHTSPALQLANWLIRQDVDRVCVLKGGLPALLAIPFGTELLVYPTPSTLND